MSSITAVVITKNEEGNIRECLSSVRWVDEIVVVDAGSSDKTVALAKKYTKKVFVRPWDGYGEARNFAIARAKSEWIFWLDADERVPEELRQEVRSAIRSDDSTVTAYSLPRKAFFLGRWIKHCGWYPARVTRIFRRSSGRFTVDKVHERLEVIGNVKNLHSDLLHYTDPNLFHYLEKFNRYTTLAAEELGSRGQEFSPTKLLIRPTWMFIKMYIVRLGFLDGIQGFILCILSSCYVFTKYAKLWEKTALRKEGAR